MVVTGTFHRAPAPSCSYHTVASIHINHQSAKRRSVRIPLLLLIRDFCMILGAVILNGDFNKVAEREPASSAPTDQRRISPSSATPVSPGLLPVVHHCGVPAEIPRLHVARMLRSRLPESRKPMVDYAPPIHSHRPCVYRPEDHGPNLALRAMLPPQVCATQAQEGRVSGRLEIPAEVFAAHQINELLATCVLCF